MPPSRLPSIHGKQQHARGVARFHNVLSVSGFTVAEVAAP